MKKILSAILSAAMSVTLLYTPVQAAEDTTPSGIEFSDISAEIENFVNENDGDYASVATAVFNDDEILYSNHFGYIDREYQITADENCVYEWGSISKMFIWVSVIQLYEQGKIDLNADIRTYLPEDFFTKFKYDESITMLNLMNHNAGWQEILTGLMVSDEKDIVSLEEALRNTEPAQIWKPGEITAYSNWGAALAAYIVQRVSGMDYVDYLHENILEPLGMEHTAVAADYRDNEWVRAQREKEKSYLILDKETIGVDIDMDQGTNINYIQLYPAGSITGTLADITKFAQAFVDDECPLFEKQETLDFMLSASDFYSDSDIPKNCHGLLPMEYGVTIIGHGGNTMAGSANLAFDKETKTGVVVLTNQYSESMFCYGIPTLIFGSTANNPICKDGKITTRNDISGNYVTSRGYFDGVGRISLVNYIQQMAVEATDNHDEFTSGGEPFMTRVSDDIYFTATEDMFYETITADGKIILEGYASDYIKSDTAVAELTALIIFAVIAVITLVLLIIKGIRKLRKRYKSIPAGKAILAGQLSRFALAIVAVLILTVVNVLPKAIIAIICIAAGASAVVCAVSAVFTAKALITEKEMTKFTRVRYALSVLFNLFVTGFVLYFELFNFWA